MRRLFLCSYINEFVKLVCMTLYGERGGVGYEVQVFS